MGLGFRVIYKAKKFKLFGIDLIYKVKKLKALPLAIPYKGACTQIIAALAPKYPNSDYFKAKVYAI